MAESLRAVETLYTLTLFRSHEPAFADFFHTLSNVQTHLKAEQRNSLKSSKITSYFHSVKTKENEASVGETDGGEVIVLD